MLNPFFWEKYANISSAKFLSRVLCGQAKNPYDNENVINRDTVQPKSQQNIKQQQTAVFTIKC